MNRKLFKIFFLTVAQIWSGGVSHASDPILIQDENGFSSEVPVKRLPIIEEVDKEKEKNEKLKKLKKENPFAHAHYIGQQLFEKVALELAHLKNAVLHLETFSGHKKPVNDKTLGELKKSVDDAIGDLVLQKPDKNMTEVLVLERPSDCFSEIIKISNREWTKRQKSLLNDLRAQSKQLGILIKRYDTEGKSGNKKEWEKKREKYMQEYFAREMKKRELLESGVQKMGANILPDDFHRQNNIVKELLKIIKKRMPKNATSQEVSSEELAQVEKLVEKWEHQQDVIERKKLENDEEKRVLKRQKEKEKKSAQVLENLEVEKQEEREEKKELRGLTKEAQETRKAMKGIEDQERNKKLLQKQEHQDARKDETFQPEINPNSREVLENRKTSYKKYYQIEKKNKLINDLNVFSPKSYTAIQKRDEMIEKAILLLENADSPAFINRVEKSVQSAIRNHTIANITREQEIDYKNALRNAKNRTEN